MATHGIIPGPRWCALISQTCWGHEPVGTVCYELSQSPLMSRQQLRSPDCYCAAVLQRLRG